MSPTSPEYPHEGRYQVGPFGGFWPRPGWDLGSCLLGFAHLTKLCHYLKGLAPRAGPGFCKIGVPLGEIGHLCPNPHTKEGIWPLLREGPPMWLQIWGIWPIVHKCDPSGVTNGTNWTTFGGRIQPQWAEFGTKLGHLAQLGTFVGKIGSSREIHMQIHEMCTFWAKDCWFFTKLN